MSLSYFVFPDLSLSLSFPASCFGGLGTCLVDLSDSDIPNVSRLHLSHHNVMLML